MEFTAHQIAEYLNGEVVGNPDVVVNVLSKIEEGTPGSLTFLANPKYNQYIYNTEASIVIINKEFEAEADIAATLVKVDDAYGAFAALLKMYNEVKHQKTGVEQPSFIAGSATVGEETYIGAFSYIGESVIVGNGTKIHPQVFLGDNVEIGKNCIIHPGVKIYADCKVGSEVTIHAGTVIGSDGFGFAPNSENSYDKIAQIGNVIIEDHVEIGSNASIDRATMGSTIIRKGVKLDNLIQIAHNVEIGENTIIASQSGVAGSTKLGKNVMLGGQVGVIGHLNIGDNVKIAAQSGIGKNLKEDEVVQGSPAFGINEYLKSYVHFRKLPQMAKDIHNIEKRLRNNE
jgi:UDP-3-O-[3-hydroxymyristoyl] glucosamine N-acyltransferase